MYTTYTKPRLNTPRQKSRSSPSSPGNHKSRRNVRQIQNQLDSLRTRQNSSILRNSVLIADISRLKQQVSHMNVSFNKLERARDSYDRYVETCMVSWVQKVFRESGTSKDVSSSYKPEPTESAVHGTPTKTIGIQTTHEHPSSLQASDWSISPETESQLLIPAMHSTMIIPSVSSKPPRDTSQRHSAPAFQTRTETSLVPHVINLSDLRAPNMPPDATLMSSYDQSIFSVYPRMMTSHPESPIPPALSTSHLCVPQQPVPSNSTPTQIPTGNNPALHSFPNVSMIAPPEGIAQSQHSFALPQQPVVYVNTIRPQFQTNQRHNETHSVPTTPPNATIQSSVNPLVETTLPLCTNFQPMNFSQGQTSDTFNIFQDHPIPPGATFQARFPGPNIPSFDSTIPIPANPRMEFTLPENATIRHHLPLYANFQPPTILQTQSNMAPNMAVQTPANPQVDLPLPPSATSHPPISIQDTIVPLSAISEPPLIPQIQAPIGTQPATFSRDLLPPSTDTIHLNREQVTQPLYTSDIRTLSPQSSDSGRHQVAQPLRHNLSPQTPKQAPPPPIHSILPPAKQASHFEPQLSHSRQPSTLPTIPEPQHETGEMAATYEPPPPAINNTSTALPRVPSAQEFQLQHLMNLERRATLDLGSEFEFKFSLNPSVSIAPTDTSNIPRHNSASSPTLDTLDNGMVSEASSEGDNDGSKLESSRNQFDLTAGEVSEEEIARKPSHIMVDTTATSKPPVNVSAIKKIGAALNAHCRDTTISGGVKIYDSIAATDAMKGQISESNVIANRILSQAEAPESNLASWDVQILGATFLSEISKYVRENGPVITAEMLLLTSRVDLECFNRHLLTNCQDLWRVINEHFASLIEAKLSADEIGVIFTPYIMKANASSEDTKKGTHILVGVLNEMFDLEVKRESIVELTQDYISDSESDYVAENKEEAYLHLLKSMTIKSVDTGVKSGPERDDIMSIPSSIVSEGSADADLDLMVPPVPPKNSDQSPTQLLDEAVGEKIESSDSDSMEEPAIYVPDFGGSESMSDRERKKKLEKLWGTEPDSGSEAESVKPAKRKASLDDFDF